MRFELADGFRKLGAHGAAAAPELARLWLGGSKVERDWAARLLIELGAHGSALVETYRGALASSKTRRRALTGLVWLGEAGAAALPDVRELLTRKPRALRVSCLQAIASFGPAGSAAAADVRGLLDDRSVRDAAWDALVALRDPNSFAMFRALLDHDEMWNRARGAAALAALGPAARPALPALQVLAREPDHGYEHRRARSRAHPACDAAVQAIGAIGPAARGALPLLREAVALPSHYDAQTAATALWRVGREAGPSVAALSRAFARQKWRTGVFDAAEIEALARRLAGPDETHRLHAAAQLAVLGARGVAVLRRAVASADAGASAEERRLASEALRRLDPR